MSVMSVGWGRRPPPLSAKEKSFIYHVKIDDSFFYYYSLFTTPSVVPL